MVGFLLVAFTHLAFLCAELHELALWLDFFFFFPKPSFAFNQSFLLVRVQQEAWFTNAFLAV
jgi:hypothetical protein